MDEVETAAADTTSGSSPFPNLLPPLSALPDLSSHPPSPPPPPPERELDEVSPQQASGFKRHHTGKLVPVGIAHPLQQQQREEKANLFSSSKSSLRVSGHARASGPLEGGEEGNSECSQSAAKKPKLADLSSGRRAEGETFESDDMASGIADFDLPVLSSSDSDNEEEQYKFTPPSYSLEEAREEGYELGEEEESMTRLPAGKEWHMFVTHSTSDIEVVKRQIMEPFSRGPRKATASYQYMAEGQYDNKAIQAAIRGSCLVLVTVSPPYLNSERSGQKLKFHCKQTLISPFFTCLLFLVSASSSPPPLLIASPPPPPPLSPSLPPPPPLPPPLSFSSDVKRNGS